MVPTGLRTLFVVLVTAWALLTTLPDIVLPWHPLSSYGFFHKGGVVSRVTPGGPAALAGVVVGDRIDLAAMPAQARHHLYGAVYANSAVSNEPLTLVLDRDGQRTSLTLRSEPLRRSLSDNISNEFLTLSECAFVLIAAWLVLFRPGRMTLAFFIYALSNAGLSTLVNASLPASMFAVQFAAAYFFSGCRAGAFAVFALRFPRDRTAGWSAWAELFILIAGITLGVLNAYAGAAPTVIGADTGGITAVVAVASYVLYSVGAAAFITVYARAGRRERQRMKWIAVGAVVGFAGSAGFDVIRWLLPGAVSVSLYNTMYSFNIVLPLALAYAVLRHRVIDVNFFVSRTLVYAILTTSVVALFGLIDWLSAHYFAEARAGTIVEIGAALVVGFWLDAFHNRLDHFVDSTLFRRRHLAEMRLRRIARALQKVNSVDAIAEALVVRTTSLMDFGSAALFIRREPGSYERIASIGWGNNHLATLPAGDLSIAQLASESEPLRLRELAWQRHDLPDGPHAPVVALPIVLRRELHAFVLYGPHVHGEEIDLDEISVLTDLGNGASIAFDHIEAETLRRKIEECEWRLQSTHGTTKDHVARRDIPALPLPAAAGSAPRANRMPALISGSIACVIALFTIGSLAPDLTRPWFPVGSAGVSIDNDEFVTRIDPRTAAATHLRAGDRLDTSDFATRMIWGWGTADLSYDPHATIPVDYLHNGRRYTATLPTYPQRRSRNDVAFGFLACVAGVVMVLTALFLVLLKPSVMTWGFFAYALALSPATSDRLAAGLSPYGILAFTGWLLLVFFLGNLGLVLFALRFPHNATSDFSRRLLTLFLALYIPVGVIYVYYVVIFPLFGWTGGNVFSIVTYVMTAYAYVIAMAGFLHTYRNAQPEDRNRAGWIIAGFAIGMAGLLIGFILSDVNLSRLAIPDWVWESAKFLGLVIPLTVLYTVVHDRVVDIRFTISRAFVFGALTTGLIGTFDLISWFFERGISATRLGTVVELAAAIAIGFWLNALRGRVNRAVDAVIFRQRHLAEEHLKRVGRGLAHAGSHPAIDYAVVAETVATMHLASAAVFIKDHDGMYERRLEIGWDGKTSHAMHPDDPTLLQLQGAGEAVRLGKTLDSAAVVPHGIARPVLAVPIFVRDQLFGAAFYGAHASGAEVDTGEMQTIERLAQSASWAYDHVEVEAMRARIDELNAALVAAGAKPAELVDRRRH